MELIRGRWYKKYINCVEDKRDYDFYRRGYYSAHERIADDYCERYNVPDITPQEKEEVSRYWGGCPKTSGRIS